MHKMLIFRRTARNSKPIEVLGTYDPIPKPPKDGEGKPFKDIKLDTARARYWLGVGAQPSDPAWRLLSMVSYYVLLCRAGELGGPLR
jgi:small subunit ribosomal protein S16